MTDQTNYVRQCSNEQMLDKQISDLRFQATDHDKIIGERHDPQWPWISMKWVFKKN